jgi:hypothetical protein
MLGSGEPTVLSAFQCWPPPCLAPAFCPLFWSRVPPARPFSVREIWEEPQVLLQDGEIHKASFHKAFFHRGSVSIKYVSLMSIHFSKEIIKTRSSQSYKMQEGEKARLGGGRILITKGENSLPSPWSFPGEKRV